MKKKIFCIIALAFAAFLAFAQQESGSVSGVAVKNLSVVRADSTMVVTMDFDISDVDINSERELRLEPVFRGEDGSEQALPAVTVAGWIRYWRIERDEKERAKTEAIYKVGDLDGQLHYQATTAYEDWMADSELILSDALSCCGISSSGSRILDSFSTPPEFVAELVYITPEREIEKIRELKGSAYIDFPVNKTDIREDYRNNPTELAKIRATIDTVRDDPDTRITHISIKGYASPEGSYSNNTRLAKGRTEALKSYVKGLYEMSESLFSTDYEPEDWEGLRAFMLTCGLENKDAILEIIDSDKDPDPKNDAIRFGYPSDYDFLLKTIYPGLRHSDYVIEYEVRAYVDVEEMKEVFRTSPGKLSLNELFVVAMTYEPGTQEYNEVFETAAHLYPDSETANLNAANAALSVKEYTRAGRYLAKAGDSAQAQYARGVLAAYDGNYDSANAYLLDAKAGGVAEAEDALLLIDKIINPITIITRL